MRTPCLWIPYKDSLRDSLRGSLRTPIRTTLKDSIRAPLTVVRSRIRILPLEFYENLLGTPLNYLLTDSRRTPLWDPVKSSLRDSAKGADDEFSKGLY